MRSIVNQCSKELSVDNNKNNQPIISNGYSTKEWAMFGLFPLLKASAVFPTQPIAKIANEQQKSVTKPNGPYNFVRAAQQIYSVRGLIGFFDGTVPSASRELLKSSYKGILQVGAKDFSKSLIPDTCYGANFIKGAISGTIVGLLDPIIIAPVERYKTFKLSQDKSGNFVTYIQGISAEQPKNISLNQRISGIGQELYRGTGVTMAKQTLMNVAFFTTKGWADAFVKPYENDYAALSMAFSSIAPGLGAALVGAPLDVAKTLKQKQTGKNVSTKELLKLVLAQSGWKGLFAGTPARFALITFGYGLNGLFLNLFDKYRSQKTEPSKVSELTKQFEKLSVKSESNLDNPELEWVNKLQQLSVSELEDYISPDTPVIFSKMPAQKLFSEKSPVENLSEDNKNETKTRLGRE